MKAKVFYKVTSFIVAFLVAVFTVGYAFAWLLDKREVEFKITGESAGAYFDATSGNGTTEDEAFVISNATHMRNLAILQNSGRFGNNTYYFKIKSDVDDINMGNLWLPPVGNDTFPFNGVFNGNGKTIKNLKVTTDKNKLSADQYPMQTQDNYEFSNAVGLFGKTGSSSVIRNFILDNPRVVVAANGVNDGENVGRTSYSTPVVDEDGNSDIVVGIAVGFVAGKCQSIGVLATDDGNTSLQIVGENTGYTTFNSILGGLDKGVNSSVTGGGHIAGSGGSGAAFGASFDVEDMVRRLNLIKANKDSSTSSWRLPDIDTSSNFVIPAKGEKVPFSINDDTSSYTGADAHEDIGNNNVGYFLGNQNKIETTKELQFTGPLINPNSPSTDWYTVAEDGTHQSPADSGRVPAWVYKYDGGYSMSKDVYTSQMGFAPLSNEEFDDLPQDVKDILPSDESQYDVKKRFLKISLSTALWLEEGQTVSPTIQLSDDNSVWSYHGQISWMGKTYGEGFRGANGEAVNENGEPYTYEKYGQQVSYKLAEYDKGIILPNSTIWFKPSQAGKVKIIMFSPGNMRGFALLKITRKSADRSNPFKADITLNSSWQYESDIEITQITRLRLPKNVLFYYEYEIKQTSIEAGNVEYMMVGENNGADFIYLDLGANASEDISTVVPDTVSAVDFIYDGVEIEQDSQSAIGVGNFIVGTGSNKALYESSKTSIYFEEVVSILKIVYLRLHNDNSGNHSGKTICLEGSDPELNTNSEVKATFATYVCPTIGGGSGTVSGGGGGTTPIDPNPGGDTVAVESVSISDAPSTLEVGKTATLTATVSPDNATNKTVTWTTSNSNIATVANGVVTAKAAGTVTITATAGGKSASVNITVTDGSTTETATTSVDFKSIFDATGGTTDANGRKDIAAQTHKDKFTFSGGKVSETFYNNQGNSFSVTLNGTINSITLVGKGASGDSTVSIVITDENGNEVVSSSPVASGTSVDLTKDNLAAGTYTVSVIKTSGGNGSVNFTEISITENNSGTVTPTPTVSEVTVTPTTASVEVDKTTTLTANVTMSDGSAYSGSVTWSSSDESKATVVNGVVTAKAAGTVTITATAGGKSATCTVTVTAVQTGGAIPVDLDMTQDTSTSTHALNLTTENGYYTITSSGGNFNYNTSTGLGNCLLAGGSKRSIIIKAGANVESLTITVKFAVGGSGSMNSSAKATITKPDGNTEEITSVVQNGVVAITEYQITLTAGQELTLYSDNRLALIGATAQVIPKG